MADDRRIIMGSYVVPKEGSLTEQNSRKWVIDNSINTTMGGKATNTDVADTQTDNDWYQEEVTFTGSYQLRNSSEADVLKFLYIKNLNASGGTVLTVSLAAEGVWSEAGDANGGANQWQASMTSNVRNGGYWNPDYYLQIAPGSSIMLRGDGTTKADAVHVFASGESKIEFIIAK